MSNQPNNPSGNPRRQAAGAIARTLLQVTACLLTLATGLPPSSLHAETTGEPPAPDRPLLVRPRQGDTPASIARRYLNDAARGWMIEEYNDSDTLSGGGAVIAPVAPFRLGGLTPDGYQTVPVLAYTDVGDTPNNGRQVSRSAFGRQMNWLKTEGFTAITPGQLVNFMEFTDQLPRRSVLITFDTASRRLYEIGIPILNEHGFTATVFLATSEVGAKGAMSWEQVKQLADKGFTIACRGRSGRSLTRRPQGQSFAAYFKSVETELRLAREAIEARLGTPCRFLAYPHGRTSRLVSAMAAKIGFSAAFSRQPGDNPFFSDRFGIHRTVIDSRTSPEQFGKKLTTLIKADLN